MEINKKNRTELKAFFQANDIPLEQHFAEFVEAGINQAEDGIAKVQGSPVALQAEGETAGTQEILNLFYNFADNNPAWSLNLNPRVDPGIPESSQSGFNIKDATGQSRLFIKSGGGNVGVGTIEPSAPLTIKGTTHSGKPDDSMQIAENSILFGGENADENADSAKIEVDENALRIYGKTSGSDAATRKLDIISDGGITVKGAVDVDGDITVKKLSADNIAASPDLDNIEASDEKVPTQMAVKTYVDTRLPKGLISMWSGTDIPQGWTLCDGTQETPDLSGRFIVGYNSSSSDYDTIGNTGGLNQVTLTQEQLPSHHHTGTTHDSGEHSHGFTGAKKRGDGTGTGSANDYYAATHRTTESSGEHNHFFQSNKTGGDQPHENRPPYFVLAYIMKL
ncbi:MAG: hypothetical protein AAF934_01390 [Bacteroidota bacterium]